MNSLIRVALIGTGRVAHHYMKIHTRGLTRSLEYVVCYDILREKNQKFSAKYGIQAAKSLSDLLEKDFDYAIIATPSGTHFEIAKKVLEAGKHALIEKPACLRVEQITELAKLSSQNKLMCKSVFQNRFNGAVKEAKDLLALNFLGKITSFSLRLIWSRDQEYYEDAWHGRWALDGGVTSQQAIHHIDCVNYLIGVPVSVFAMGQNSINLLEAEDTLVSVVRIDPKIIGTFHFTTASRPSDLEASLLIVGEKTAIRISGTALNHLEVFDPIKEVWNVRVNQEVESGYGYGHAEVLQYFLESNSIPAYPSLEDSFAAVMVVDSLYESLEKSNEIVVDREYSRSKLGL